VRVLPEESYLFILHTRRSELRRICITWFVARHSNLQVPGPELLAAITLVSALFSRV
jgi:hypothetical protein